MASKPVFSIDQNFLDIYTPRINVQYLQENAVTEEILTDFLQGIPTPRAIGCAPAFTTKGSLTVVALAVKSQALLIELSPNNRRQSNEKSGRQLIQDLILCNPDCMIYALDLIYVALGLYDRGMRLHHGVDIQSAVTGRSPRDPAFAIEFAMTAAKVHTQSANIRNAFLAEWDPESHKSKTYLALRAWIACYLATVVDFGERLRDIKPVNTMLMTPDRLEPLSIMLRGDRQLDSTKVTSTTPQFSQVRQNGRKTHVEMERYTNRLRGSDQRVIVWVRDRKTGAEYPLHVQTAEVSGRTATFKSPFLAGKEILRVITMDADGPTMADQKKNAEILAVLQAGVDSFQSPFSQYVWQHDPNFTWPEDFATSTSSPSHPTPVKASSPLNDSQLQAVQHMLMSDNEHRVTIVQGPPGTGKTSVIAAYVESAVAAGRSGIWLIAQSNVAVKNIAEKLDKVGFDAWRLLVSKDFKFDWHDHLYRKIGSKVVQSDRFKYAQRELDKCHVILCTLSMLSNDRIDLFTKHVPIHTLVVDEASQIKVSDYLNPFNNFPSLCKLCFIGDDKQLPPFGQEQSSDIKSIFEVPHIREQALLLNTQYRMPSQLGDFISEAMYDGQLLSFPGHACYNDNANCFFVNVVGSKEVPDNTSIKNEQEADVIIKIAAKLQEEQESYRIITPYDAQRNLLEYKLKAHGLDWSNKCFNVDSFQGNEDEVIILSLVRTREIGFLKDERRTNVMLTRCKKYLYVVTSKEFLLDSKLGLATMVGHLAGWCKFPDNPDQDPWIELIDIDLGNF